MVTLKQSKSRSSCSGLKQWTRWASISSTFFTMASCFPAWASQISSRSSRLSSCISRRNLTTLVTLSTYCGWCRFARSNSEKTYTDITSKRKSIWPDRTRIFEEQTHIVRGQNGSLNLCTKLRKWTSLFTREQLQMKRDSPIITNHITDTNYTQCPAVTTQWSLGSSNGKISLMGKRW